MPKKNHQSFMARVVLAMVLMIGFYLLAAVIIGLLLFVVYLEIAGGRVSLYLTLLCLFAAGVIVWSILPRIDRFQAPGPRLEQAKNPALFKELNRIAQVTRQKMPSEVYLLNEANAFVTQRGGFGGIGGKRVMGIGLPLLCALTVPQLSAVLAHEFGHYYGGDTRLGPLIFRTRNMVIRTVSGLKSNNWLIYVIRLPFFVYGQLFLRITQSISRTQELSADRLAARVAGTQNTVTALRDIHGIALTWQAYWSKEYAPVLASGYAPPLADGFNRFLKVKKIAEKVAELIEKEAQASQTDPYDSHPSLKDRIRALQETPDLAENEAKNPAIELIPEILELEAALLKKLTAINHLAEPRPVTWDQVVSLVYLPAWQESVRLQNHILKGVTPENLSQVVSGIDQLSTTVKGDDDLPFEKRQSLVFNAFGASLSLALLQRGWQVSNSPGESVYMVKGIQKIECFEILPRLQSGDLPPEAWASTCRGLGINGLDLAGTVV